MACIICSGTKTRLISQRDRKGRPLHTLLCEGCGLVHNDPVPSDADLAAFYTSDYRKSYKGADRPRPRQILRNFERLKRHLDTFSDMLEPARDVLDVGAGSGEFAFAMAEMGKNVRGIEPNEGYALYCREELGINVQTGLLGPESAEPESLDLINLTHVLEHMNRPVEQLALLSSFLRPGGLLYVEVPDIFDYAATKSKGNLFHFGHIWNFSPFTLRAAAGLAGLTECAETKARCAGKTSIFLRKATSVSPDPGACAQNALDVAAALEKHFAEGPHRRREGVPFTRFFTGVAETHRARRYAGPKEIGRGVLGD